MNWLDKLIGKAQGGHVTPDAPPLPPRRDGDTVVRPRTDPVQPADGSGVFRAVEAEVAAGWKVGDVVFDIYEVKQIHDGGGMGLVYRVHHRGWNVDLAVKSPRQEYFQRQTDRDNFTRECETWIRLGFHPHVVSCYYVRAVDGVPWVFAEYVEGGSLHDWIKSRRLYEGGRKEALKRILDIAIQTAWGLQYAHEHDLIHQDVKPANVMITADGTAKITDFGLAKARAAIGGSPVAQTGQTLFVSAGGMTPAYCSPEQALFEPLSRKTDIWSWAVSLLEMFTGGVLWQTGVSAPELLEHLDEIGAETGIPGPPPELLKVIEHCLTTEPGGRPDSFLAVADCLISINHALTGDDYSREQPEAAMLIAAALNNRAVSMLDLGRADEAAVFFDQALASEPGHPQATYNRGLHLWRSGRMTDDVIVKALEQSQANRPNNPDVPYLLGLVHLERGDAAKAASALSAPKLRVNDEVRQALADATYPGLGAPRCFGPFEGHTERVSTVALNADGVWALSGSEDNTLRVWEVSSGRCLRTINGLRERVEGHRESVSSAALSADGRWAISAGLFSGVLDHWDANSGKCLGSFERKSSAKSVVLSKDDRLALAASGGIDKTFSLWEVARGKVLRTFEGHTGGVLSVALSADAQWIVSGSGDKTLRLWDASSGKAIRTFEGHRGGVLAVALGVDGHWALSGSADRTLRLWEVSSGKVLRTFKGHTEGVSSVALSADGRWAWSGSSDHTIRLWDLSNGKCCRTFERHTDDVTSVALRADGCWAWSGYGNTFHLWDQHALLDGGLNRRVPVVLCRVAGTKESLAVQNRFQVLLNAAEMALSEGAFAHAWSLVAESRALPEHHFSARALDYAHKAGSRGMRTRLRGGWCKRTFEGHTHSVRSVALSVDGRAALSGSEDRTIRLWDVNSSKCLRSFVGHSETVNSVALSADGRRALSGSDDQTIRRWNVDSGECLKAREDLSSGVGSVALSADGCRALAGFGNAWSRLMDVTFGLWDVCSGECLRTFKGHRGRVNSMVFSADERWALSGSEDKTLRLWEVSSSKCLRVFLGHKEYVNSLALSADGQWALSGSEDKSLRLWELSSGTCIRTFEGHNHEITSVALTADGRWALSGSKDRTLRLWEVSSGQCLRVFEGHRGPVESIALSADSRWVLSGSEDNTLRLWELEWDYEFPEQTGWDEGAHPRLITFLTMHTPYVSTDPNHPECLLRRGSPTWNDADRLGLEKTLQAAGYGWLHSDCVDRELERLTTEWQCPPPMPWEQPG